MSEEEKRARTSEIALARWRRLGEALIRAFELGVRLEGEPWGEKREAELFHAEQIAMRKLEHDPPETR